MSDSDAGSNFAALFFQRYFVRRRLLVSLTALTCALAAQANFARAQAALAPAPPIHSPVDANGVNVTTGTFNLTAHEISIGQVGSGGLEYARSFIGSGWRDNLIGTISASGAVYTVSLGGSSESFTLSGGVYTSNEGKGSTLSFNSGTQKYSYTSSTGDVVVFDKALSETVPYVADQGQVASVAHPSGETLTYSYKTVSLCVVSGGGCSSHVPAIRLQSVTNNLGYQLKLTYSSNVAVNSTDQTAWQTLTNVIGINNAVDYCDPTADTCGSFTVTWPSITYATPVDNAAARTSTDTLGRVTRYTYDTSGRVVGLRRPTSSSDDTTIAYDTSSRVASMTNSVGSWGYGYVDDGILRTTTITDPLSHARAVRSFNPPSIIFLETDALGHQTSYAQDSLGRQTQVVNPEGDQTTWAYDSRGNVTTVTRIAKPGSGLANIVVSASYPTSCTNPVICNKPTTTTDARGNVTNYTYDSTHGGVLTVTSPAPTTGATQPQTRLSYTALYAYYKNSGGMIVAASTPVYRVTGVSACQATASCSGAVDEVKRTTTYGTTGVANNLLPTSTSVGSGDGALTATTALTYDSVGNVLTVDGPLAGTADTTRYRYDLGRQIVGVVAPDPDGAGSLKYPATRLTYNNDGQVTLVEQGTVNSQSDADWAAMSVLQQQATAYDTLSRKVTQTQADGSTVIAATQYSYDADNKPDCTAVRMNPSIFGSLPSWACTLATTGTNGDDFITRNTYDAAGQLTKVTNGYGTVYQTDTQTLDYTANGKLATVKDAMTNLTTYEYDGFDRLAKLRYPLLTRGSNSSSITDYESYGYDAASNLTSLRRRSGNADTIAFTYDALNRLTLKDIPGGTGQDVYYSYDLLGRPLYAHFASAGGAGVDIAWDALGRQTSSTTSSRTLSYQWDLAGNRTRVTWPDSFYVNYLYDTLNRVTQLQENGATTGVGVLANYTYDDLGRRTTITRAGPSGSTTGATTNYAYAAGRLSSLTQDLSGTTKDLTFTYGYDASGGIVSRSLSNNLYASHPSALSKGYVANGLDQYATVAGTSFTHDARGNLTSDGTRNFTYDIENRLLTASAPTAVTLGYDPLGRLQTSTAGATTTTFLYDGQNLAAEYNAGGTVLRRYVPGVGVDEPVVWYEGSGTATRRWLATDEAGSVVGFSGNTGGSGATYGYGPFGEPDSWTGSRYRYTGQIMIPDAQLYHFKRRIYDPSLGRFLQADPIGQAANVNIYAYAGNDPANFKDPTGLEDGYGSSPPITVYGGQCQQIACLAGEFAINFILDHQVLFQSLFSFSNVNTSGSSALQNPSQRAKICDSVLPNKSTIRKNVKTIENMQREQMEDAVNSGSDGSSAYFSAAGYFFGKVSPGGDWAGRLGEPAGNWNYGATGRAAGIPLSVLLRGAGAAEIAESLTGRTGSGQTGQGNPLGGPPYGDNPVGQAQIKEGYNAQCN